MSMFRRFEKRSEGLMSFERFKAQGFGNFETFFNRYGRIENIHKLRVETGKFNPEDPLDKAYICFLRLKTEHPDLVQKIRDALVQEENYRLSSGSIPLSDPDYELHVQAAIREKQKFSEREVFIPLYEAYKIMRGYGAPPEGMSVDF